MPNVEVLKFGSSVLRSSADLPEAVDEVYRRWRSGANVLAVVSAFEGVTDQLMAEAIALFGANSPGPLATYIATGEQKTAALLAGALCQSGIHARFADPREIGLAADGPQLESAPVSVDIMALNALWTEVPVVVLPGYYGVGADGSISLFGRGGSDISAIFLAAQLNAHCRLLKDVHGVFEADPAVNPAARRYQALSWARAIDVSGPLIQPKALQFAQSHALRFEVGRANEDIGTSVGESVDRWAPRKALAAPLRIVLLGCGALARGVRAAINRYPRRFEIAHVIVREVEKHRDLQGATEDWNRAVDPMIDIVVACVPAGNDSDSIIQAALRANKFVIAAQDASIAARLDASGVYCKGDPRRLWFGETMNGRRVELASATGTALSRQGAEEWRATTSVMGDLHELARIISDSRASH